MTTSSRCPAPAWAGRSWRCRGSSRRPCTSFRVLASVDDLQAHGTRRAGDHHHGRLDRVAVEVWHLELGDFANLSLRDLADLVPIGLSRSLLDPGFLLEEHRGGRRLQDEAEGLIREDRDLDRENRVLALRPRIELFAEGHDVDTLRAKRRTHWRSWVGLARGDLQLDEPHDFLCHKTPVNDPP